MDEATDNLQLPYIMPSQAQKHVTHNEALRRLDAVAQIGLVDILDTPPAAPDDGAVYGIGASPAGAWEGAAGQLAAWQDGAWQIIAPRRGWLGWRRGEARLYVHDGTEWQAYGAEGTLPMLGIEASADDTNRLSVASPASLFSHAGADHRMKINKAGTDDTASLLFQSGFSGRAEMGLAGTDRFCLKTSGDGGTWTVALEVSEDGRVLLPNRPLARAALLPASHAPAEGSFTGFEALSVEQGGFLLGAAVPGGLGNRIVVPASGHYIVTLLLAQDAVGGPCSATVLANGITEILDTGAISAAPHAKRHASTLAWLDAGDWIAIRHSGAASLSFGPGKTEIVLAALP